MEKWNAKKKPTRSPEDAFGISTLMNRQDAMRKEIFFSRSRKNRDVVAKRKNSRRGKKKRIGRGWEVIKMYKVILEKLNI